MNTSNGAKNIFLTLCFLVVCAVAFMHLFTFTVKEGQVGIVSRFSKILRDDAGHFDVHKPGIYFKWPMIEEVKYLDSRIQTLNTPKTEPFITSEKKELYIDYYVQWRIKDGSIEQFYLKTQGDTMHAEVLIRKYIESSLREQIGNLTIQEIVTGQSHNNPNEESNSKREQIMQTALVNAEQKAKELGVAIVDVRMKQINLPPAVSSSIYKRMSTERNAVAQLHRSEGKKEAERIKANADREANIKISEAEKKAKEIRAAGDAKAANIYATAYKKDIELYEFLRSMEAYKNSFSQGESVIVTDKHNQFFKYFQ